MILKVLSQRKHVSMQGGRLLGGGMTLGFTGSKKVSRMLVDLQQQVTRGLHLRFEWNC